MNGRYITQSARNLPVLASVDVVVVGGTTAGVAAATAAVQEGAKVFLVAPEPYIGEDQCATLRFGDAAATPAGIKATLASRLLDAGVEFLYASYVSDILRDAKGDPCGVVIANRGGRQAILATVFIDATDNAWICRMAGCRSTPWSGGTVTFERTMLVDGSRGKEGESDLPEAKVLSIDIEMPDFSYASLLMAEKIAGEQIPRGHLLRAAERLFCIPPNPILCRDSDRDAVAGFQPVDQERFFVLSGCAGVSRQTADLLLRPGGLTVMGTRIGRAAAKQAKALPVPVGVHAPVTEAASAVRGDICEDLGGGRPLDRSLPTVLCGETAIPVLADVDVLVVGGGTAGAAAAIAAARQGACVLCVEYQKGLGGVGTLGLIGKPYHGNHIGFAAEVPFPDNIETKMEWYRNELDKAGAIVWFGAMGCGAFVEGRKVRGAVVCTPQRRGVVLAKVVIDGTGNGDTAIAAGADYEYGAIEEGDIALQGTGIGPRPLRSAYANHDALLVDESDMIDVQRAITSAHLAQEARYDIVSLIQTRERRRVRGDFVMRYIDQIAGRTYSDSVVFSGSDYDSHGYPSSPFFELIPHDAESRARNHPAPGGTCHTPYRCLLPRDLDNLLVIGLGISMDRDASAMVRMQFDMANQGYAAGVAAAVAARDGIAPRRIDVKALQEHLAGIGCLPATVLVHEDSFPLPTSNIQQAVSDFGRANNPAEAAKPLGIILTHPEAALPFVRQMYGEAEGAARIAYAKILSAHGDPTGVPTLIEALEAARWDAKIYQGRMADYACLPTPVDSLVLALGRAGDRTAVPTILAMAEQLDAGITLSHHRAIALALERLADPAAAKTLAELLQKPGMRGYAMTVIPGGTECLEARTESLREIVLGRALYRCGDHQGLGASILREYRKDVRGLFARHADRLLRNASAALTSGAT